MVSGYSTDKSVSIRHRLLATLKRAECHSVRFLSCQEIITVPYPDSILGQETLLSYNCQLR